MTSSPPEPNIAPQPTAELPRAGVSLPKLLVVASVLLPSSAILITWSLVVVTNNLDVAYALGVSDTFLTGFVIAAAGLATGLITALLAGLRRWELVGAPVAGLIVGVGIHLGFAAFQPGEVLELGLLGFMTIGIGQMIAVVASTRIALRPLAGVVLAVMVLGISAAGLIQAIPEAPAEVSLVLDEYTVEDATGRCSGAGALAGVVEGSALLLRELPVGSGRPAEMGSVVLPQGLEAGGTCRFELGSPLGLPVAGYERIDFLPESDPGVPYTVSLEGNRVIVTLHRAEA